MPTEKTTQPTSMEPVTVAVIGGGDVTGGPTPITSGTEAVTPSANQPNLLIQVVSPIVALLIRFGHIYFASLVGLIAGGMATDAIPYDDFFQLVMKCAGLSVPGAAFDALKNVVTIFGRLESRWPLITGSV